MRLLLGLLLLLAGYERVTNVHVFPSQGCYTLVLETGSGYLPMCISTEQAFEINRALIGARGFRPTTHDLAAELAKMLGISAVSIDKLVNSTYYASIWLGFRRLDSRPSDAVSICLRNKCNIFVKRDLLFPKQNPERVQRPGGSFLL